MPPPIYTQTVIAFLWDFDKTLIPGYQQEPLFRRYGIDSATFWNEVNNLEETYADWGLRVAKDSAYLGHILTYVETGVFGDLTNDLLRELGAELETSEGIPEFIHQTREHVRSNAEYRKHDIEVEHYVVSTGLAKMIEGSPVGPAVDGIWANEFIDQPLPPGYLNDLPTRGEGQAIKQIGYMIDNTTKTRAVFEINKGVNVLEGVDVNQLIPHDERRVPIKNMIYVADGPSDVPVFSILNQYGGRTFGVYLPDGSNFSSVKSLQDQGRVQGMAEANYSEGSHAWRWLINSVDEIASDIVRTRTTYMLDRPGAPGHTS